ncbi:MAG: hypothetical protein IPN74_17940 [Haliscomenobacter sp.]|nr:hypothetical protein [Haliscomenobacter sp.]
MLGGADYNWVMTPPNYEFRIRGFDQYTLGYGGGILLGMEYGRLEIGPDSCIRLQYTPLPVIFIKGNAQKASWAKSFSAFSSIWSTCRYTSGDAIKKTNGERTLPVARRFK